MRSQRDTKQWIKAVAAHLGMTISELARLAKVSPSTLTRYVNDTEGAIGISQKTLDALAAASGVSVHQAPPRGRGFQEEAQPFDADNSDAAFARAVKALTQERNGLAPFVVRGFGLDLLGYMPDDVVIVDLNRVAKAGDVVVAQRYIWERETAETLLRLYDPPYLLAAASRAGIEKPLVVDDDRIVIKGVAGPKLSPGRKPG